MFKNNICRSNFFYIAVIPLLILLSCQLPNEKGQIRVGIITALTGENAQYGKFCRQGIELAAKTAQKNKVTLFFEDSRGEPKLSVSSFQKLLNVNNVHLVISAGTSSEALAIAPLATSNKIPVLAPWATTPELTGSSPYIFRNVASDIYEGSVMGDFVAKKLAIATIALAYVNNDYGIGISNAFRKELNKSGEITIVAEELFSQGAIDFRAQITRIKASNPDALYLIGYKEMVRFLEQAEILNLQLQILGASPFEDPEILQKAPTISKNAYFTSQSFYADSSSVLVSKFLEQYGEKYKQSPNVYSALAYDAMKITLEVTSNSTSSDDIVNALKNLQEFPGVTGKTSFDQNGDVIKPVRIKKIVNGEFKWVSKNEQP